MRQWRDALLALAVDEKIIDCDQAHPRVLADPDLMRCVKKAARRRGFDVDRADVNCGRRTERADSVGMQNPSPLPPHRASALEGGRSPIATPAGMRHLTQQHTIAGGTATEDLSGENGNIANNQ